MLQDRVDRLARKVAAMVRRDAMRVGAPLGVADVDAFEARHGVVLPAAHRLMLSQVADGGEGPPWGLFPLADAAAFHEAPADIRDECTLVPDVRLTDDEWDELLWKDDGGRQYYPGVLQLGDLGCGYMTQLVLNGPARGRVLATFDDEMAPSFTSYIDVVAWYEGWLDLWMCGARPDWHGLRPGDREEAHRVLADRSVAAVYRAQAAEALAALGPGDAPDASDRSGLRAAAADPDPSVRAAAFAAFGRCPCRYADELRPIRDDADDRVASIARLCLGDDG